jgi:endonuclease YncB( thermonuclease family)
VPRSPATPVPDLRTFEALVRGVEETLLEGTRRIDRATVFANWETGRLINQHILLNQARAAYATQVMPRLAKRVGLSERVLYSCSQFHRRVPILNLSSKLSWTHFRTLCRIEDEKQRQALIKETEKRGWTVAQLDDRVRQIKSVAEPSSGAAPQSRIELLTPKRGTPGLHPVIARRGGLAVDLGFKVYLPLSADDVRRLKLTAGSIVQSDADGKLARADAATKADLFAYRTLLTRVVDGDTLAVTIDLPPCHELDKKLRLRGLDCPEMDTAAGRAAKGFTQALVDRAVSIVLTTTKPDKYDRYLADVFVVTAAGEEIFLNNALLENGHAVCMGSGATVELL